MLRSLTPSACTNLGNVLFADAHAEVDGRRAGDLWTVLPAVTVPGEDNGLGGLYLDGRAPGPGTGRPRPVSGSSSCR